MSGIYSPCPNCFREMPKDPVFEKHQGRYSVLCPHCLSHRSEWASTIEEAIISWNTYMREQSECNTFYLFDINYLFSSENK